MSLAEELTYPTVEIDKIEPSAIWIESQPLARVRIDSLVLSDSPRLDAEDPVHVRVLAEAGDRLPPITVHRPTLRVIDGAHRVRAALLNGQTEITARLLDCDPADAFVLSVRANIAHGLPLSRADRAAAAARIVLTHPQWSDSAVAAATGISDKTASRIRAQSSAADATQPSTRIGRDGRVRPVDSAQRRRHAAAIFLERPDAGLREVARATGLSPATVRNVRQRIDRGEDPVPGRYRTAQDDERTGTSSVAAGSARQRPPTPAPDHLVRGTVDRQKLLAKLSGDPSLRHTEAGRRALRWLHQYSVDGASIETLGSGLPCHWAPEVADLARSCAATWNKLAAQLQQRTE
ncbi:ParB N-terminal domain-containing protein [Streptomyces sp. NPDC059639]|uniref:ParB/RepB/Spo0J family partition protein n=1 Tax=Streptomyces sp. NPDC059639 TaxID=3346891 RepID=UPI00367AD0E5